MDTLTHALSGALLARATTLRQPDETTLPLGRRVFLGFVAAALPDLDFVMGQFGFFRWFAAYPILYRVDTGNPSTCVWFQDLRFFTPGRGRWPFRFGMCREEGGAWEPFQLVGENTRVPAR